MSVGAGPRLSWFALGNAAGRQSVSVGASPCVSLFPLDIASAAGYWEAGRTETAGDGMSELIPKHGGYRKLKSFQVARLVYDVTVRFCDRYIDRRSRTRDQMVQAARSGVQNIAEGSEASATSRKMELKLTQVAAPASRN